MRRFWFFIILLSAIGPSVSAQEATPPPGPGLTASLAAINLGFRFDDNVYQVVAAQDRISDGIYSLNWGGRLNARYGPFRCDLGYRLGADQYLSNPVLDNLKNDFSLLADAETGALNLYFRKDLFVRDSQYAEFNYQDDENLLGALWSPRGPWSCEVKLRDFSRYYYDEGDSSIRTQNFVDQGFLAGVRREISDKFSLKLEGSYNNRQFDRYALGPNLQGIPGSPLQTDETWTGILNARIYFQSILQDITFQAARTDSNTYGFSNTVESVSWAAVVRPVSTLYLQLLFRLFSKTYDTPPPDNILQSIGFIDEDSQDLLSIKASWDWAPLWTGSIGLSRFRNEYIQAGQYYIKNIVDFQVRRGF